METTTKILNILNGYVEKGTLEAVIYNSASKANVELDVTAHPCAVLYIFRDGSIDLIGGTYREVAEVNVLFLTHQEQLDFDAIENDALMDSMVEVARDFIDDVIGSDIGEIVNDAIEVRGLYDYNDKNTTGVALRFSIRSYPECL